MEKVRELGLHTPRGRGWGVQRGVVGHWLGPGACPVPGVGTVWAGQSCWGREGRWSQRWVAGEGAHISWTIVGLTLHASVKRGDSGWFSAEGVT